MSVTTLRFGPFELDPLRRSLLRDGTPVRLRPMAITLLCHLAQHRERVVPKKELLETLWPDGSGTEANLTVTIAAVRKALGEVAGQHRILITVPREGYQFVARLDDGDGTQSPMPRHLAVLPIEIRGEPSEERVEVTERVRDYHPAPCPLPRGVDHRCAGARRHRRRKHDGDRRPARGHRHPPGHPGSERGKRCNST